MSSSSSSSSAQRQFFIVSVTRTHREHRLISLFRPDCKGYAWPLAWAGRYEESEVRADLGYFNCGASNLAVPCEVIEAISQPPRPGEVDGDVGPVVLNNAASWRTIIGNAIERPLSSPQPQYRGGAKVRDSEHAVFAFVCSVRGFVSKTTINARTRTQARLDYFYDLRDMQPRLRFTDVYARKVGAPVSDPQFLRTAARRGLPNLRCGHRVSVDDATGVVVGHDSSENFRVLFDDSTRFGQIPHSVHPMEMSVLK